MSTSSFRVGLSSLAVLVSIVVLWPVIGHAEPTQAPGTESSAGGATDAWLVARGLIGHGMVGEQSGLNAMTPPTGVEVDETRQTENRTGQLVMQAKSWNETIGDDTVHIEVTTLSGTSVRSRFLAISQSSAGLHHVSMDAVRSWSRAAERVLAQRRGGAAAGRGRDLPHDLYPDAVPWVAFLRVLEAPREGAEGILNQQITPYSYVGQDVSAKGIEQITVPAGTFSALKVIAQVDIATVMPNWPRFVLHVIKPVIPRNTLYFEAAPPYRLLKQEGATFVGGPEVTTELIRFYVVGAAAAVGAALAAPLGRRWTRRPPPCLRRLADYQNDRSFCSQTASLLCRHGSGWSITHIVTYYLTVSQTDHTMSPLHDLRIVGGKNESRAGGAIETFHHVEKGDSSGRVQIRCGLVRQNERRFRDHGASDGNPLLLPAGQLRRTTIFKAREADFRKQLFHSFLALRARACPAGAG